MNKNAVLYKVLRGGAYAAISAVIAYIISLIAQDPTVFGVGTPIINMILITIKGAWDGDKAK